MKPVEQKSFLEIKSAFLLLIKPVLNNIFFRSNEESVQIVRKQTEYSQYKSQVRFLD